MTMLTMTARPASGFGATLHRAAQALWRALETQGAQRAERHLLDFAHRCETLQPDLARELRSAARRTRG